MASRKEQGVAHEAKPSESAEGEELLLEIAERTPVLPGRTDVAVVLLVGLDERGRPLVQAADWPEPRPARTTVPVSLEQVGAEAVLGFEGGDASRPLLLGLLLPERNESAPEVRAPVEIERDGQRVEVEAEKELVLRCGKASITLTRAGKILIRGAYVSSRSSGVNRILGGSVEIN